MKTMILALSLALVSSGALAQTSTASSSTSASAGVTAAGNQQGVTFNSRSTTSDSLRTVPPVAGQAFYGSFSTDSCMVSGGGGGSVMGFGINLAVPVEDSNCSLRRNFERTMQAAATTRDQDKSRKLETAAVDMLCQTDKATRAALSAQGLCTNLEAVAAAAVVPPNTASAAPPQTTAYAVPSQRLSMGNPVLAPQSPRRIPDTARARIDDLFTPG
ncbi:hypothetical protein [Bordetella genomosp. 5]|uniref:hypothetical protein n=1 Tax=Bordetella genomosp. 5 TaxID=1395608 RepID=UPI0020165761|nr:hypothetical protein [Bordetella genomosp. 5]